MAKYLAQIVVLGAQVVGRAFARAIQQEFAAGRVAAQESGGKRAQAEASLKMGMTLQEAQNILNVSELDAEKIQKSYDHLFSVNDRSMGGSLYLQSKASPWLLQTAPVPLQRCTAVSYRCYSQSSFSGVFSDESRSLCTKRLAEMTPFPYRKRTDIREAAVLVPLCTVLGEPSVLLTLRSVNLERHRGGVSFPGGMRDAGDADLIKTALRETEEEIGITSDAIHVWTALKPLPSSSGKILITPVLAYIGQVDPKKCWFNKNEVEAVFSRTLESLCKPENCRSTQFRNKYGITLPVYLGGEHHIWGITAAILYYVLQALVPEIYKHDLHYYRFSNR